MTFADENYNRIDEFNTSVAPKLKELQDELQRHGINFIFCACVAQNHPRDGQDLVSFVSNFGLPQTDYNSPKIKELLQVVQNLAVVVTHPNAVTHGIYVPVVLPTKTNNN